MPPGQACEESSHAYPRSGPSKVVFNRNVGPGWYLLRLAETSIAAASGPGQFVQIGCADAQAYDPLLRRPFSVYDVDREAGTYDILYIVTGRGTRWMASLPEDGGESNGLETFVDVIGPFGNRFSRPCAEDAVILVAGGVGVAPLHFFARELCDEPGTPDIVLCMGARSSALLQGIDDFRRLPIRCAVSTNDGSEGYHGFVTQLVESLVEGELAGVPRARLRVYGCGPTGMNDALRALAVERELACEICIEAHMACGFGICFACVVPIAKEVGGPIFNRRICIEGPVFDARLLAEGLGAH